MERLPTFNWRFARAAGRFLSNEQPYEESRALNEQRRYGLEALARGDYGQALTWFHLAAAGGDADAQHNLALMYRAGLGIEVDAEEAMRLLTRAADQGHAGSRYTLAISYRDGYGVDADPLRALHWMKEAAAARHPEAMRELARACAGGDGVSECVDRGSCAH